MGADVQVCEHRVSAAALALSSTPAALDWARSLGLAGHQPPGGSR